MTIVPWKTRPESVRKILSIVENQERTLDYIARDIEWLYQIWIQAGRQIEFPDIFRQFFQVWAERSIINVFEHTDVQSPIEQVFLNTLIFVSLIEYPLGFVVTPPLTYQQRQVLKEQYLKNVALWDDEKNMIKKWIEGCKSFTLHYYLLKRLSKHLKTTALMSFRFQRIG